MNSITKQFEQGRSCNVLDSWDKDANPLVRLIRARKTLSDLPIHKVQHRTLNEIIDGSVDTFTGHNYVDTRTHRIQHRTLDEIIDDTDDIHTSNNNLGLPRHRIQHRTLDAIIDDAADNFSCQNSLAIPRQRIQHRTLNEILDDAVDNLTLPRHRIQHRNLDKIVADAADNYTSNNNNVALPRQRVPHLNVYESIDDADDTYWPTDNTDRNDNKKKVDIYNLMKKTDLPLHVQELLKPPRPINPDDCPATWRSGMNAYNDKENLQSKRIIENKRRGTKFKNFVLKNIKPKCLVVETFKTSNTSLSRSRLDLTEETTHYVDQKAENLAAYPITLIQPFHFKKTAHEDYTYLGDQPLPDWVVDRYEQAAEYIRFTLPSEIRLLEGVSPIDYLARFTKLHDVLSLRYRRLFNQFKEKVKPEVILKNNIFMALSRLCNNYLIVQNYNTLIENTMVKEHNLNSAEFAGLCALCERHYWSLCINNPPYWGNRTPLEALDFRGLEWKCRTWTVPLILKNLLISLKAPR